MSAACFTSKRPCNPSRSRRHRLVSFGEASECRLPHTLLVDGGVVVKKIQLNEEQWKTLEALREAHARGCPTDSIKISERLRSNGLVASDRHGYKFLTEQGLQRLNQGR
ncbi:hypothetical protein QTI24_04935 [Variovorax sp. J22P240]|uniref:hypothetical protein n=1 Tax=Variovorax sp. J22P240 TaxID=3053514 RepID=UPI0025752AC2|nr:hypothetical protein [Variovorax sp. J22P240]MDL9997937.1 hypothetical protein [Variovorax sp. J22P240]MDM0049408.1 hypothetical protein [Variovorax sp. J22R115]